MENILEFTCAECQKKRHHLKMAASKKHFNQKMDNNLMVLFVSAEVMDAMNPAK